MCEAVLAANLTDPASRYSVATLSNDIAKVLAGEEQERVSHRSIKLLGDLVNECPDVPKYRDALVYSRILYSHCLDERGERTKSEEVLRTALASAEKLVVDFPGTPDYRRTLAEVLLRLGSRLEASEKTEEAREINERGVALLEKLIGDYPDRKGYKKFYDSYMAYKLAPPDQAEGDAAMPTPNMMQRLLEEARALLDDSPPGNDSNSRFLPVRESISRPTAH
jgi:hypothetical protein